MPVASTTAKELKISDIDDLLNPSFVSDTWKSMSPSASKNRENLRHTLTMNGHPHFLNNELHATHHRHDRAGSWRPFIGDLYTVLCYNRKYAAPYYVDLHSVDSQRHGHCHYRNGRPTTDRPQPHTNRANCTT